MISPEQRADGASGDPSLSIIMPAYNEAAILEDSVGEVVAGLRERDVDFELVVVENGSTDDTGKIAARLEETYHELRVERLAHADYGRALRAGLLSARAEYVVNFDVDYYDLDFLDVAVERMREEGAAIVVGSKRAVGATDTRPALRRLVTAVFTTVLRRGFGLSVSDTHGMKAMRRIDVLDFARDCQFGTDLFDTELILRVERSGLATAEVPVRVEERRPARTSILTRAPRTLIGLVRLRIALWRDK